MGRLESLSDFDFRKAHQRTQMELGVFESDLFNWPRFSLRSDFKRRLVVPFVGRDWLRDRVTKLVLEQSDR